MAKVKNTRPTGAVQKSKKTTNTKNYSLQLLKQVPIPNEHKGYVHVLSGQTMSSSGVVYDMTSNIQRGTDAYSRLGDKINAKSMTIRGLIYQSSDIFYPGSYRFIIFVDKNSNGTAPTISDLLTSSTFDADINIQNRSRFVILKEVINTLDIPVTLWNGTDYKAFGQGRAFKWYLPLDFQIGFKGNSGTSSDNQQNSIYMAVITDVNTNVQFQCKSRIMFTDD